MSITRCEWVELGLHSFCHTMFMSYIHHHETCLRIRYLGDDIKSSPWIIICGNFHIGCFDTCEKANVAAVSLTLALAVGT